MVDQFFARTDHTLSCEEFTPTVEKEGVLLSEEIQPINRKTTTSTVRTNIGVINITSSTKEIFGTTVKDRVSGTPTNTLKQTLVSHLTLGAS